MFFADYYSLFIQILSCGIVCICRNQEKVCIFLSPMQCVCIFVQGGVLFFHRLLIIFASEML